ncbi:NAD(P)H-binding protein [uncultured Pseudacidovorax sp.]|uniref:NAD(P)H-binding protein n=1 Tax=uncultured Pseudacidovorax sp. TaxID=679313 RepID=UPI0025DFEE02|nr:NAD(P)H-binding protein [uncultured Pseudacidovorax sp.]
MTRLRVLLLGASGTIGGATAAALRARGHEVVCVLRPQAQVPAAARSSPASLRFGDVADPAWLAASVFRRGERFDAVLSCMASRSGEPADAWAVDFMAHHQVMRAARHVGVPLFVLLSALCVQKPRLAFQQAKLAFERELAASGMDRVIVRPTAFFKSLSGQVERVRQGRPYLLLGDGRRTACQPISDADLAHYLVDCLQDRSRWNRVLPIGGPGPAITPREQGEALFALLGRPPRFRQVPPVLLDGIAGGLGLAARWVPALAAKAELARIGCYYANESMLVWDAQRACYDAGATPSTGRDTLFAHYAALLKGEATDARGAHAVF